MTRLARFAMAWAAALLLLFGAFALAVGLDTVAWRLP